MKKLLDHLGTIIVATIVTALIWLYAEDASVREYTDQPVRMQFVGPAGEELIITPDDPVTVRVDFVGSNGQYQQFLDATRDKVIKVDLRQFDENADYLEVPVDMREQLERYVFRDLDLGINITGVSPQNVPVTYEKILTQQLDIRVVQDTGEIKLTKAEINRTDQRKATISILASEKQRLAGVVATARIRAADVENLPRGEDQIIKVPVELPSGFDGLTLSPPVIDVLVSVANDRERITIDRRPVLLSYPSSINERFIVSIPDSARFITAFTLVGPREQIELLKADPTSTEVWATVRLTNEEADLAVTGDGTVTKAVEVIAPAGVVPASEFARVTISVRPRPSATTPPP